MRQDITERRRTQKMLDETHTRSQAVFNNALDPIMLLDDTRRWVDVNPATCEFLGYSREELLRMTADDLSPAEDRADIPTLFARLVADGKLSGEHRLRCKDGTIRDVEFHAVANILPGLHLRIIRDITDRKRAEEKLKTGAVQLAEAQRIAHLGSWSWDLLTGIIQWSDEHYRIVGMRPQETEITYERFLTYVHPDDRTTVENIVRQALQDGQPFEYRLRALHRDGAVRLLQSRGRVALDENDKPLRIYGIVLDITERQRTEDALREYADRLQVLSHRVIEIQEEERRHLAHELHDEIGQVLSAVAVNLHMVKGICDAAAGARLDESINLVERATQQVRNLSLDLRPSMLDDLGLISTLRWYADRQAQRAGFVLHFHAESYGDRLPAELEITCYRIVQEALTNVVRHARAREVWVEFIARDEEAELYIRDDGIGFDLPTVLAKAFRGASFGVLGMKERVELLAGQFEIKSEPSCGTRIRAFLPVPNA